jgi:hypothetical protein
MVSLSVGATATVGAPTDSLLSIAPGANVGVGGSNVLAVQTGIPVLDGGTPTGSEGATLILGNGESTGPASFPLIAPGGQNFADSGGSGGGRNAQPSEPVSAPANGGAESQPAPAPAATNAFPTLAALLLTAEDVQGADGGGALATPATPAAADLSSAPVDEGGAAATAAQRVDGGGSATPAASLLPETSELATNFQPFNLGRIRDALTSLINRVAPQGSWLANLLSRLAQWAPWLAGAVVVGFAYDVNRRRRRRAARSTGKSGVA